MLGEILPGSLLLYAPFYASFSRSGMGLGMVGNLTTNFPNFFIIFGFFLFLILSFLDFQMYQTLPHRSYWRIMVLALGIIGFAYSISRLVFHRNYATLLFLGFLIFLTCHLMFKQHAMRLNLQRQLPERIYVWLCVIYACLITMGCEIVFVKDFLQGGEYKRMNTIFKFYIPAWYLFTIATAYALFQLYQSRKSPPSPLYKRGGTASYLSLRSLITWHWIVVAGLLFLMSAVFPIMGSMVRRYHDLYPRNYLSPTLDGLAYLREKYPDEYRAIRWLNANVTGTPVILEASKADYLYEYARISSNTGLPTVLGWQSHAEQREHWGQAHQRNLDIKEIYTSPDITRVRQLLAHYDVAYIYVGQTERQDFPASGLWKFAIHPEYFEEVFRSGSAIIYQVKK
jgi:YYY domain-containing protein